MEYIFSAKANPSGCPSFPGALDALFRVSSGAMKVRIKTIEMRDTTSPAMDELRSFESD